MRIDAQAPAYVVEIKRPQPAASDTPAQAPQASAAAKPASRERVEFSAALREITSLKQQLAALPEVRLDKVALARQQLQSGPYRQDAQLVAQGLLNAYGTGR